MKKLTNLFAISILAVLGLVSCNQNDNGFSNNDDRKIFLSVGSPVAKSGAVDYETDEDFLFAESCPMQNGDTLVITAFLSDMNESVPVSKGAPVTTDNIKTVYGRFLNTVYQGTNPYGNIENLGVYYNESDGIWYYDNGIHYWPESSSTKLDFCSMAPSEYLGSKVKDLKWHDGDKLQLSFSYDAPARTDDYKDKDAEAQQDLIFAINSQTVNDATTDGKKKFAQINFSHALTAVKFVKGDIGDCTIDTISLNKFMSTAKAIAVQTNLTPGTGLTYTWSNWSALANYTQVFGTVVNDLGDKASLDPTTTEDHTFMVIPQPLDANAEVKIVVKFGDGQTQDIKVNLKTALTNVKDNGDLSDWSKYAGKVVTLRVNRSGVAIQVDEKFETKAVKENVGAKNVGGKAEYVRMAVVANWVDKDGNIVKACDWTTEGELVPKPSPASESNWVKGTDGYYYYKYAINPGQVTNGKLFNSYTPAAAPDPSWHLEMDVIVQGVIFDHTDTQKTILKGAWGDIPGGIQPRTEGSPDAID